MVFVSSWEFLSEAELYLQDPKSVDQELGCTL